MSLMLAVQSIATACRLCVEGVHECAPGACGCSVCASPPVRSPASEPPEPLPNAAIRRSDKKTQVILLTGAPLHNRDFLGKLLPVGSRRPTWNPEGWWEVARKHFDVVLAGLLDRFAEVEVYSGDQYEYTAVKRGVTRKGK